jgi:hypothetical protein
VTRPLLILDCDGVLLHFLAPFTRWLDARHGLTLRMDSFALSGNVRRVDGTPVEDTMFRPLLDGFFDEAQETQTLLPGVGEALAGLGETAELVVLTNIEPRHRAVREVVLAREGLPVRVLPNGEGVPKGRAVAELAAGRIAVFVDDLPPHHTSVRKHAPHVGRLHLVAEESVWPVMPAAPDAHARIDDWATAHGWITDWFARGGA